MPRGNWRAPFCWINRSQRPYRSYRENFRSCRKIPRWLKRNSGAAGTTGSPPERDSVSREPVRTLWAAVQKCNSKPAHSRPMQTLKSILPFLPLCFRKRIEQLTSELSEAVRNLENSDKEKRQLQKTVAEQDTKLNDMLDRS